LSRLKGRGKSARLVYSRFDYGRHGDQTNWPRCPPRRGSSVQQIVRHYKMNCLVALHRVRSRVLFISFACSSHTGVRIVLGSPEPDLISFVLGLRLPGDCILKNLQRLGTFRSSYQHSCAATLLTRSMSHSTFESPGPATISNRPSSKGCMPNSASSKPRWQELYEAASVETDGEKLTDLINRVEEALTLRAHEIAHGPEHAHERNAMVQASENLLVIKTEKLSWPPIKMK
jgi:hypothetical protein